MLLELSYLRDKFPRNLDSIDPWEGVALILALFTSLMTNAMRLRWEVGDLKLKFTKRGKFRFKRKITFRNERVRNSDVFSSFL